MNNAANFQNDKYEKDIAIEDISLTAFYLRNIELKHNLTCSRREKKLIEWMDLLNCQ